LVSFVAFTLHNSVGSKALPYSVIKEALHVGVTTVPLRRIGSVEAKILACLASSLDRSKCLAALCGH
jgi:hypothetical protein